MLLVQFKVLHDHVVAEAVSLVPVLPIVHHVREGLLVESVEVHTVAIEERMRDGDDTYR